MYIHVFNTLSNYIIDVNMLKTIYAPSRTKFTNVTKLLK